MRRVMPGNSGRVTDRAVILLKQMGVGESRFRRNPGRIRLCVNNSNGKVNAFLSTGTQMVFQTRQGNLTFWHRNYFFLILAQPVYKM